MNNNRYSANVTRDVNYGLAKGRRPVGKGSRTTTYSQLVRTNQDEVDVHVSGMRCKRRQADRRSRGSDPHQEKWYLEESKAAVAKNLEHFLYFSELLRRKSGTQPALPTVVEFVIFILGCPQHHSLFGTVRPTPIVVDVTPVQIDHDTLDEWESNTQTPTLTHWGPDDHVPNFDDEHDIPS